MGLDYSVDVAYGFYLEGESAWNLPARLGRPDYEIDGFPEAELLDILGYSGLRIIANHSDPPASAWAICAKDSPKHISPKYDVGNWMVGEEIIPDEAMASLIVARDTLFPLLEGETAVRPRIGWFLLSSIW